MENANDARRLWFRYIDVGSRRAELEELLEECWLESLRVLSADYTGM